MGLTKNLGWLSKYITADSSGLIGIGTVPSYGLDIQGASAASAYLNITKTGYASAFLQAYDSGVYIGSSNNYPLAFNTNNIQRAQVGTNGNLIVGVSGSNTGLILRQATSVDRFQIFVGSGSPYIADDNYIKSYNTDLHFLAGPTGSDERMRITTGGNLLLRSTTDSGYQCTIGSTAGNLMYFTLGSASVQMFMGSNSDFYISTANNNGVKLAVGAQSWSAYSDIRLKNITGEIENALDSVNTLSAARFTLKSDPTNKPRVGLIAQEVQKVLPEVIDVEEDGILSVRYTELIPLLVGAIKELTERIKTLENK